ncbi:hypothetical protein UlMin_041608 [Ulmus minor]
MRNNKKLHLTLYQSLKMSFYKPTALFRGILFPLCELGMSNLREAVILGSIIQKVSIPLLHSRYILLEKKHALSYRALDALVAHFMIFLEDTQVMPTSTPEIIRELNNSRKRGQKEDDLNFYFILYSSKAYSKNLLWNWFSDINYCYLDNMLPSPYSVINRLSKEDRFDVLDVPMEED